MRFEMGDFRVEVGDDCVDHHAVVDALMEAAGDDAAEWSGALMDDGEGSAVHGVAGEGEAFAV